MSTSNIDTHLNQCLKITPQNTPIKTNSLHSGVDVPVFWPFLPRPDPRQLLHTACGSTRAHSTLHTRHQHLLSHDLNFSQVVDFSEFLLAQTSSFSRNSSLKISLAPPIELAYSLSSPTLFTSNYPPPSNQHAPPLVDRPLIARCGHHRHRNYFRPLHFVFQGRNRSGQAPDRVFHFGVGSSRRIAQHGAVSSSKLACSPKRAHFHRRRYRHSDFRQHRNRK